MSRPIKNTPYERYMLEAFQMGKNPNEVYHAINFQELMKNENPYTHAAQYTTDITSGLKKGVKVN